MISCVLKHRNKGTGRQKNQNIIKNHVIMTDIFTFSSYTYVNYQNKHLILFPKKIKNRRLCYLVCVKLQSWEFLYIIFLTEWPFPFLIHKYERLHIQFPLRERKLDMLSLKLGRLKFLDLTLYSKWDYQFLNLNNALNCLKMF